MVFFIAIVAFSGVIAFLLTLLLAGWYEHKYGNPFDLFSDKKIIFDKKSNSNHFKCASGCDGDWSVDWYPMPTPKGDRFCPNCTGAD